ncbi:UDP-N-acetylmuramoylalanine--D-glutamate ligase [hydrothermal vent metagenome]|uniref:UDP-N-acetylmuramoylalanine--D-glutamate ligase n=1 Tax=hydrothermal vent metagenome TaxID=652676 RepID=A0A3B0WTT2_9ZZZZ
MSVTAETLSSISVAALVTAMVANDKHSSEYTLVVGLGITGLSVVRHLQKKNKHIVVVDSRNNPPGKEVLAGEFPQVELYAGGFDEALFMGAEQIVVSPGVSLKENAVQHALEQGVEVIGDIELFARQNKVSVIAVTGSNGKSTVISLLGEMAKTVGINARVGGNIGVPVLDLIHSNADLYILELSSFQLESVQSLAPIAAAVLNVSPDHMDRYDSYEEYVSTKMRIYKQCKAAVLNRDDQSIAPMQASHKQVSGFTLNEPAQGDFGLRTLDREVWLCKGSSKLIAEKSLRLSGQHNLANALAALALGEVAGFPLADMLSTLMHFSGLGHRTQRVAEKNQVCWVNDSKGTNVGATIAAINGLKIENKLILIAGGLAKGADFSALKNAVEKNTRTVVLMGKDAVKIEQALQACVPVFYAKDMQDAVQIAESLSHPGDTVLLSPACASFDMFNGFEHRGEMFVQAVEGLQ